MVKIERRKGSLTPRELAQITSSRPVVRKVRPDKSHSRGPMREGLVRRGG